MYNIVFNGSLVLKTSKESAINNLAKFLDVSEASAKYLFSGNEFVFKQVSSYHDANIICEKLSVLGISCSIVTSQNLSDSAQKINICPKCHNIKAICQCISNKKKNSSDIFDLPTKLQSYNKYASLCLQIGFALIMIAMSYNEYLANKFCANSSNSIYVPGAIMLAAGGFFLAKFKGYSNYAIYALTLIPPIGLPILIILPDKLSYSKSSMFNLNSLVAILALCVTTYLCYEHFKTQKIINDHVEYIAKKQKEIGGFDPENMDAQTNEWISIIRTNHKIFNENGLCINEEQKLTLSLYKALEAYIQSITKAKEIQFDKKNDDSFFFDIAHFKAYKPYAKKLTDEIQFLLLTSNGYCKKYNDNYIKSLYVINSYMKYAKYNQSARASRAGWLNDLKNQSH